jgi:hypothetical protein
VFDNQYLIARLTKTLSPKITNIFQLYTPSVGRHFSSSQGYQNLSKHTCCRSRYPPQLGGIFQAVEVVKTCRNILVVGQDTSSVGRHFQTVKVIKFVETYFLSVEIPPLHRSPLDSWEAFFKRSRLSNLSKHTCCRSEYPLSCRGEIYQITFIAIRKILTFNILNRDVCSQTLNFFIRA